MAQDVEPGDVGQQDGRSRDRRRGPLPLLLLAILVVIIVWLLSQFLGMYPGKNETTTITKTSTIDVTVPVVPTPDTPASIGATDASANEQTVPDVVGDPRASAVLALQNSGYVVSPTYVYSDSTPAGIVIDQNPTGGAALRTGADVGIIISRGTTDIPMVTMPDVIGLTQSAAEAKVKAAGLRPYILHGTSAVYPGRVGSQWPLAGSRLPRGSEGFIQVMITP